MSTTSTDHGQSKSGDAQTRRRNSPPAADNSARINSFFAVAILVFTIAAYLPALNAGFIWDDDDYVTQNPTLKNVHGLARIWFDPRATPQYYPLVHTTFWIEHQLWQFNPHGFHAVNILLHATAAILLGLVLSRLQVVGAWLITAIFALHPVHVESVAWITERKNVLSAVFYFAAALVYLKFAQSQEQSSRNARPTSVQFHFVKSSTYWLALALFACALLSKTVTCSLPAALLLVRWWKTGRLTARDVLPLIPFFAIGLGLGLHTAWLEKHSVGARGVDWELSFLERCLIAGRALWFYAGKLLWPSQLTFIYPRGQISTHVWWQWLFPFATAGTVVVLWLARKRIGRGPLVAALFFIGTLVPALGFVDVYPMRYSFVADHFQYLASIGLIALACAAAMKIFRHAAFVIPLLLALLTWQQTHVYRDLETLWRDTLKKNPGCWMAHNNLGLLLDHQGDSASALNHYREALRLKPDYPEPLNNIGTILLTQGRTDEAMDYFNKSFAADPAYAEAVSNIGIALFKQGRTNDAVQKFRATLDINPKSQAALINLGVALTALKQYDEAVAHLQTAVSERPDQLDARLNLGGALMDSGKPREAADQFRYVLNAAPNDVRAMKGLANSFALSGNAADALDLYARVVAVVPGDVESHYSMGVLLSGSGRTEEAIAAYERALRHDPQHSEAHNNLGADLARKGQWQKAAEHLREALRLNPAYAEAHNNLAFVLAQTGRRDEAIAHLNEALKLRPDYSAARQQLRDLGVATE